MVDWRLELGKKSLGQKRCLRLMGDSIIQCPLTITNKIINNSHQIIHTNTQQNKLKIISLNHPQQDIQIPKTSKYRIRHMNKYILDKLIKGWNVFDILSTCIDYIILREQIQRMMNMNELYLQVKGKWKSLYPIYFDSNKSIKEGRRLSKSLCIQAPTLQQLAKAVCFCQLRNIIQPHKLYPRDYFQTGRLKIELCKDDGKPIHQHLPNKKAMLVKVAEKLRLIRQK